MADYLHNDVFDNGLTVLPTNTENLYICNAMPTTFTEAQTTYKLGTKATPAIGAPTARTPNGRKVVVSAIADGTINTNGTATHYALTDDSATKLLAAGALNASQVVSSGNPFTLTAFDIGIPAPV